MVKRKVQAHGAGGAPVWPAGKSGIWSGRWDQDPAQPTTVLIQHPSNPFMVEVPDAEDEALWAAAYKYLEDDAIKPLHSLPEGWIKALKSGASSKRFGWMPVAWPLSGGAKEFNEPFGSFRVGAETGDHQVALFATERIGPDQFLGSGFGLRIVLRLRALGGGRFEASINGLTACLPYGDYRSWSVDCAESADQIAQFFSRELIGAEKAQIAAVSGLAVNTVRLRGLRILILGGIQLEWRSVGLRAMPEKVAEGQKPDSDIPYAFTTRHTHANRLKPIATLLHLSPLVADAGPGDAPVFVRDAASHRDAEKLRERRTTRAPDALKPYREDKLIPDDGPPPVPAPAFPLEDGARLKVLPCPGFVRADIGKIAPREVPLPGSVPREPAVRSDDASAVQGFWHTRGLFRRLDAYGLPPDEYFRIAKPVIDVAYRSGVRPGPGKDGRTVNARVLPEGWPADFFGSKPIGNRPALQLHLALANLSRRARAPWIPGAGRSPAEPLGIGADARWMWHEFGHVLLMATTGELELRFAHSPGDALAAIVADPESELAVDAVAPLWRFATFPWVFLPRRHDRCVLHGWSWNGAMRAGLATAPDEMQPRRKGYASEQILSSSLFRLYRCLGGDTVHPGISASADGSQRRGASHYSVYLLMRALQLLGDARIVPARTPEELVFALVLADICTGEWRATFASDIGPTTYARTGGCAHKAIRWAFEAQGLYREPNENRNAPGSPPAVDIYIASRRLDVDHTPYGDVDYGPGSYLPVSLHWQNANGSSAVPEWQATTDAISVRGDGQIEVEVGNRGQQVAHDVEVSVWWAAWPPNAASLVWPDASVWKQGIPAISPMKDVAPGPAVSFGPFVLTAPASGYVVLAQATCAEDRANIDATTGFACVLKTTPIVDIVANDNNLGLLVRL